MSEPITVYIDDPNIKSKLAELPEKMLEYAFEIMMERAHLIVGLAQIYCPVDTGSLRDSIRVERGGIGKSWREVRVRAGGYVTNPKTGKLVNYASFQEFGTRYIYGTYFLTRAVEEVKPTIEMMLRENVVQKVIQ
jgi:Bacteriophage HK97-gp10, putative tail-component